jgi:hypothetical protein
MYQPSLQIRFHIILKLIGFIYNLRKITYHIFHFHQSTFLPIIFIWYIIVLMIIIVAVMNILLFFLIYQQRCFQIFSRVGQVFIIIIIIILIVL